MQRQPVLLGYVVVNKVKEVSVACYIPLNVGKDRTERQPVLAA